MLTTNEKGLGGLDRARTWPLDESVVSAETSGANSGAA